MTRLRSSLTKHNARPIGSLVSSWDKGVQPDGYVDDGSVAVVKSKDVVVSGIDIGACERTTPDLIQEGGRLREGLVVVNMTGQGTLGRSAVVPALDEQQVVASVDLAILEVDEDACVADYLSLVLNSSVGRVQSIAAQTGSSGQQHLYPDQISELLVPLGPSAENPVDLSWQKELVQVVRAR